MLILGEVWGEDKRKVEKETFLLSEFFHVEVVLLFSVAIGVMGEKE